MRRHWGVWTLGLLVFTSVGCGLGTTWGMWTERLDCPSEQWTRSKEGPLVLHIKHNPRASRFSPALASPGLNSPAGPCKQPFSGPFSWL